MRTSFKILVSKNTVTWQLHQTTVMITIKNNVFELLCGIKNIYWSKLYQWYIHFGKPFLQLLLLGRHSKVCSMLWFVWVFFAFLEKRRPSRYCLWKKIKFSICRCLIWCAKVQSYFENSTLEYWLCLRLFLWQTQK